MKTKWIVFAGMFKCATLTTWTVCSTQHKQFTHTHTRTHTHTHTHIHTQTQLTHSEYVYC